MPKSKRDRKGERPDLPPVSPAPLDPIPALTSLLCSVPRSLPDADAQERFGGQAGAYH